MDDFFDRLIVRAATIDELLSDAFEPMPGQKDDADLATRRLAAWCRSCASGDWSLFNRRLQRDGLSLAEVLARFATVRRDPSTPPPEWIHDAIWIETALQNPRADPAVVRTGAAAFEHLFHPIVKEADAIVQSGIDERASAFLSASARANLRRLLLGSLSDLFAPPLYELFAYARKAEALPDANKQLNEESTRLYDSFVANMKEGGFRQLFLAKPVLLRVAATVTRQWINNTREFVTRLDADLSTIRHDILHCSANCQVTEIQGELSDPHNGGSVLSVRFKDGSKVVYKPKDLQIDVAWHALVERLNRAGAPIELKAVRTVARNGYGWTEHIDHLGCTDTAAFKQFFQRAGALLALFHCFAANDMHEENMIAAGDHPVPIDLEMLFQATSVEHKPEEPEAEASEVAMTIIDNSVMMVGLLPIVERSPNNKLITMGGMTSARNQSARILWNHINSDAMRPAHQMGIGTDFPNLPHVKGRYAKFGDYIDDFVAGFERYATFLMSRSNRADLGGLFDGFVSLPVRKIVRPTRFYHMLLQRLNNHQSMEDGVVWSAQADFVARLADWQASSDPLWPLQHSERAALMTMNIPHFTTLSDCSEIHSTGRVSVPMSAIPGFSRAQSRVRDLDRQAIDSQIEFIEQSTAAVSQLGGEPRGAAKEARFLHVGTLPPESERAFLDDANRIAAYLRSRAIRKGPAATWIGFNWPGDAEAAQLMPLDADLYSGVSGIALFFAAHFAATGCDASRELALASVAHLRKTISGHNAPRVARYLGTGAGTGLGSIVYAFTVMAKFLRDDTLLDDAHIVARLFSDDLIRADRRLDVMGGNAGGILGLLRLYRDGQSADVLGRALRCGANLLAQPRCGVNGGSWIAQGFSERPLNGMAHGAAGYAYALGALASATGRDEFADAALQCIAFENSSYHVLHGNWPDFRADKGPQWACQWCHGASGIGMARAAMVKGAEPAFKSLTADVYNAVDCVMRSWPNNVDTLCCGTLGNIEFLSEAATVLGQNELQELATRRLMAVTEEAAGSGDYHWNIGTRSANVGLFRGLAGVAYTLLRRLDIAVPNVLIWE